MSSEDSLQQFVDPDVAKGMPLSGLKFRDIWQAGAFPGSQQFNDALAQGYYQQTGGGASSEGGNEAQYGLNQAAMPAFAPTGAAAGVLEHGGDKFGSGSHWTPIEMVNGKPDPNASLYNAKAVYNDPNYGWVTPSWNDKHNAASGSDKWLPQIMKAVALSVIGGGLGSGLAGLAGGGLLGDLAGGVGKLALGSAVSGQGPNLNPLSLASNALGYVPGMDQIMPYVKLASGAYGASKGNLGAAAGTLGQLYNLGGGGP